MEYIDRRFVCLVNVVYENINMIGEMVGPIDKLKASAVYIRRYGLANHLAIESKLALLYATLAQLPTENGKHVEELRSIVDWKSVGSASVGAADRRRRCQQRGGVGPGAGD